MNPRWLIIVPFCQLNNRKFYKLGLASLCKMILEEVRSHPFRDDIYINQIVTTHNDVKESEKIIINRILLKEIVREGIEILS